MSSSECPLPSAHALQLMGLRCVWCTGRRSHGQRAFIASTTASIWHGRAGLQGCGVLLSAQYWLLANGRLGRTTPYVTTCSQAWYFRQACLTRAGSSFLARLCRIRLFRDRREDAPLSLPLLEGA